MTSLGDNLLTKQGCRPAPVIGVRSVARRRLRTLEPGRDAPAGSRDAVLNHLEYSGVQHLHVRRSPSVQVHQ